VITVLCGTDDIIIFDSRDRTKVIKEYFQEHCGRDLEEYEEIVQNRKGAVIYLTMNLHLQTEVQQLLDEEKN